MKRNIVAGGQKVWGVKGHYVYGVPMSRTWYRVRITYADPAQDVEVIDLHGRALAEEFVRTYSRAKGVRQVELTWIREARLTPGVTAGDFSTFYEPRYMDRRPLKEQFI